MEPTKVSFFSINLPHRPPFYHTAMRIGKINKEILLLAIPNILTNITEPLLSSVDTALMGHEGDVVYIAAVGLGSMVFNMLYWSFSFLRMGTTGMTAQAFGREDKYEMGAIFYRGILLAMLIASAMILLQQPIERFGIWAMAADAETSSYMSEYIRIRIWAAPATLGLMVLIGWFLGMQNARIPLVLTLLINVVNIALSYYFVRVLHWNIEGVALGTVISVYAGFLVGLLVFFYTYRKRVFQFTVRMVSKWMELKAFFHVNRDLFLRTVLLIIAFSFFFNRSSLLGVAILGINQIYFQFVNWMAYAIDGFAYAAESLVGKYFGKQDTKSLSQVIKWSFVWGGILAGIFVLIFAFWPGTLLGLFTDDSSIVNMALPFLIWIIIYPIFGIASYIWDGIFIGLTASRAMRDTMFISVISMLLCYFLLREYGNHGLWISLICFVTVRGLLQTVWYQKRWLK